MADKSYISRAWHRRGSSPTLRWPLAPALGLCLAAVVAGTLLPVARPPLPTTVDDAALFEPVAPIEAATEDLGAFLASRRWGISLAEAYEGGATPAPPLAAGINPELAKLGVVGVTVHRGTFRALVLVDGGVVRRSAGETLPDGQTTLAAIDDNTVTLASAGGETQVLVLFPPVSTP